MQVNILGLADDDIIDHAIRTDSMNGEIWTVNDWYQFHRRLRKPNRVFNLHTFPHINLTTSRFLGDWKKEYNESEAEIVTTEKIHGIKNQKLLNQRELIDYCGSKKFLRCSISTMIYVAILEKVTRIDLYGVQLGMTEYRNHVWGIVQAIDKARAEGIEVNVIPETYETSWRESRFNGVDHFRKTHTDITLCYWETRCPVTNIKLNPDNTEMNHES